METIEALKDRIQRKKEIADRLRHEISVSTRLLVQYDHEIDDLSRAASKAEIATLGEWRPPAVDD